MSRLRTIKAALADIKENDKNSCLSLNAIRCMVVSGEIPSIKIGAKYLLDIDFLEDYISKKLLFPVVNEPEIIEEIPDIDDCDIRPISRKK